MAKRAWYGISLEVKRWRWYPSRLPFGRCCLYMEKETTWQNAHDMASQAAEKGAANVCVLRLEGPTT